ncbi:MAG: FKBP-type peptidyl-prolyl cis-trans isomerase [Ignavibacteriaceae bacterium]|nr:FKBP-type peptidyl-prolyl cis-trans isomerase [Ignavibacteriaceae bacterium]
MRKLLLFSLALLLFVGCGKKVITTKSGIRYSIDTVGHGNVAKEGDFVTVHYRLWVVKDSSKMFKDWVSDTTKKKDLLGDTRVTNQPAKFVLGAGVLLGAEDAVIGMQKGETRSIIVPSSITFGDKGYGPIPPKSNLKFVVTLLDTKEQLNMWNVDTTNIQATPSGLKYIIIQKGTGASPDSGNTVMVKYSGFLTNGKRFDSSVERDEPFTFTLGMHQVIPGWEEGIKLVNKGSRVRFIIPPSLGFGNRKIGQIPANSVLIFDVELIDMR